MKAIAVNILQHVLLGLLVAFVCGGVYLLTFWMDPFGRALFVGWMVQTMCWLFHEAADYARSIRIKPNEWRHWWEIFRVDRWEPDQQRDFGAGSAILALLFIGTYALVA